MTGRIWIFMIFGLILAAGQSARAASPYPWLDALPSRADTMQSRIPVPTGFSRVAAPSGSFGDWLRNLPLFPTGSPVRLYPVANGKLKSRQDVHEAVVNLDVLRYQQCADTAIRLWAEYLWSQNRAAEELCFHLTNGDRACWKDWARGMRPKVSNEGKQLTWVRTGAQDAGRKQFLQYLDSVMTFAGTYSLKKELAPARADGIQIGDILIQGGFPGHAVMIVDLAKSPSGVVMVLLAQSYMPSQEMHVLKNLSEPRYSPWYPVTDREEIETPEWTPFNLSRDLRRFSKP